MSIRQSSLDAAIVAWGNYIPDWVVALAVACDKHRSQRKVAEAIGYSSATVSLVLKHKYNGDYGKVEIMVRGALLRETAACLVFGTIKLNECQDYQNGKRFTSGMWKRVFRKSCPTCPFRRDKTTGGNYGNQ